MSQASEALAKDFQEILASGINHTGTVMEMLQKKGWNSSVIVPLVYQALLRGLLEPKGQRDPFRVN
jgi:hypothetical protein